jgi:hypothetical protein
VIRKPLILLPFLCFILTAVSLAQTPDAPPAPQDQTQGPPPKDGPGAGHNEGMRRGPGTMGKIANMNGDSLVITRPDGVSVSVKLTDQTQFRKDRQPAKLADFKVGDFVMVRGEENPDHSITAQVMGGRSANGGPGGMRGGQFLGEMGKEFIAGEVQSIDAPKITVLRVDKVTQTVELNEETSLRKGRDSITMADIQPGDHVVLHGSLQNNAFVPRSLSVLSPEQWDRLQQIAQSMGRAGESAPATAPSNNSPHQ